MSSIFAHGLMGISIYACGSSPLALDRKLSSLKRRSNLLAEVGWLILLVAAAVAPDLDYVIPLLDKRNFGGLRVTHSIALDLVLPAILVVGAFMLPIARKTQFRMGVQAIVAGLSHLLLDLFVGVSPAPLLWPLSRVAVVLPFGLLPSAGRLQWGNYYLYRNLLIEMGVLLPLVCCAVVFFRTYWRWHANFGGMRSWARLSWLVAFWGLNIAISAYFARQAYLLPR